MATSDDVQVLVSSIDNCDLCHAGHNLYIEPRSFAKNLMTVYGMTGTYQVRHLVKRCSGCNTGFMYGYRVCAGRIKKYDSDCLTRRILGKILHSKINKKINIFC